MTAPRRSRRWMLRTLTAGSLAGPGLLRAASETAHAAGPRAPEAQSLRAAFAPTLGMADEGRAIPLQVPDDVGEDEHWVDVNLTELAAVSMVGRQWLRVALVTTGKPGWDTPEGEFRIVRRVPSETMTSASLAITDPTDQYVLTGVLYTQYFTEVGHALHLNYWQPDRVFGAERTSHGCVGMRLADAEHFWNHLALGSRVVLHL